MRPRTLALLAAAMTLARAADVLAFEAPESKLFTTRDFKLESGVVLPELTLAYETYGTLAAGRPQRRAAAPTATPAAITPPGATAPRARPRATRPATSAAGTS